MKILSEILLCLFLTTFLYAGVQEDILNLEDETQAFYAVHGRYYIGDPTPAEIPTEGATLNITEMEKHSQEPESKMQFTPTAKDYQFHVIGWQNASGWKTKVITRGYKIIAKRMLKNGILEEFSIGDLYGE